MFERCLFCRLEFRRNETLEHFPYAREISFDPAKGRLWAICEGCGRWTLAPIEERWEALEELERSTASYKVLARTENITLLAGSHIEVVRIGAARLREEAWWRYGHRLVRRRFASLGVTAGAGTAALVASSLVFGPMALAAPVAALAYCPYLLYLAPTAARTMRFGWIGWHRRTPCLACGHEHAALSYSRMRRSRVVRGKRAGELGVRVDCSKCKKAGLHFNATEAELFVRRHLAYRNMFGARGSRVLQAAAHIDDAGSSAGLVNRLARERTRLDTLDRTSILAFEMAMNDQIERELLALRLADLAARWKEAEEIAAIADGELTPLPPRTDPA